MPLVHILSQFNPTHMFTPYFANIQFGPLHGELYLNYIFKFSKYLIENTLYPHYKNQSSAHNHCFRSEIYYDVMQKFIDVSEGGPVTVFRVEEYVTSRRR
jgi:hypothetical protein